MSNYDDINGGRDELISKKGCYIYARSLRKAEKTKERTTLARMRCLYPKCTEKTSNYKKFCIKHILLNSGARWVINNYQSR